MGNDIMSDQSDSLRRILEAGVDVLVYHGMMDMLLPVSGMATALNHINWTRQEEWKAVAGKTPYWYNKPHDDDEIGGGQQPPELMGYVQSLPRLNSTLGDLTFVTVRNAGHMVPIDQPKWSAKIVRDFLAKDHDQSP